MNASLDPTPPLQKHSRAKPCMEGAPQLPDLPADMRNEIEFQFAVLAETSDHMQELPHPDRIEWLFCKRAGEDSCDFYQHDAIVASVNLETPRFDLHNLLGIIVVGSTGAFETFQQRWNAALPSSAIRFMHVPEFDPLAILSAALECLAGDLTQHRRHSGRAALDLACYRREFDRLQASFRRLEEYVARQSLQVASEIFEYPPDPVAVANSQTVSQSGDPSVTSSLLQYVPVDSFGASSFSVYIRAKPESTAGLLRITLKAIETGRTYGTWSLTSVDAAIGWIELALDYAIDESAVSLVISVNWPADTSDWSLALGPPHPYIEFRAYTETGRYLAAPLALRVFSGLPGARVQPVTSAIRPIDAPHALTQFLPYESYSKIAQVLPRLNNGSAASVSYDPVIGCVTVHPRKGGLITIGRMDVGVPKQAWRISAQIRLAHELASPTQFALMIDSPNDSDPDLEALEQMTTASPGFSGWHVLSAFAQGEIAALIAPAHPDRLSMYLMTRQAADSNPDFGWARFSKFEFDILPLSSSTEKLAEALTSTWCTPDPSLQIVPPHAR